MHTGNKMEKKSFAKRMAGLIFGLALYGVGIVFVMNAGLGFAPWEVLHGGIGDKVGAQVGTISILLGLVIVIADYRLGETLGMGTLLNMLLIGSFMNLFVWMDFVPFPQELPFKLLCMAIGLLINAFATYFYIAAGMGTWPRDCLMVILSRRTGVTAGKCKMVVEWTAVAIGWLLGGSVGVGTVIAAFGGGFFTDMVFKLFKFDPKEIVHETFFESLAHIIKTDIK